MDNLIRASLAHRVQVVAGKGGVGRTTVSSALALRYAQMGARTLLVEFDVADSAAHALGVPAAADSPVEVRDNLWLCRVTPSGSVREYALMVLRFRALYQLVFENKLVKYMLQSIPGLGEFCMLGKIWFHSQEKIKGQLRFDHIVIDAPATGHAVTLLSSAKTVSEIAPPGLMKDKATLMAEMVKKAVMNVVVLPEEMPVNEAIELTKMVPAKLDISLGFFVANRCMDESILKDVGSEKVKELSKVLEVDLLERAKNRLLRQKKNLSVLLDYTDKPIIEIGDYSLALAQHRLDFARSAIDKATGEDISNELVEQTSSKISNQSDFEDLSEPLDNYQPGQNQRGQLQEILSGARCVVCVGPGGVGKTSTAAAMAIDGVFKGRRTVVLTIDPARRLANALGLDSVGSIETMIDNQAFIDAGLSEPKAKLSALMLDIKQAWDEVVRTYHPDEDKRQKLLNNDFYQALSTAMAGSQEYMAMEKLHQLANREHDRLDLIVLDTPPATNAIDFLEAPNRLVNALSNDATKWLLKPYRRSGWLSGGSSLVVATLSKLTGTELLEKLAELLEGLSAMFEGFQDRANAVQKLLTDPQTIFVVVSSPDEAGMDRAEQFAKKLLDHGVNLKAIILNRCEERLVLPDDLASKFAEKRRERTFARVIEHFGPR